MIRSIVDADLYTIAVFRTPDHHLEPDDPADLVAHVSMKVAGHPKLTDDEINAVVALVRARLIERRGTSDTVMR